MENPRIYVACLASYNAGKLFGEWIEITPHDDETSLHEAISAMLSRSPAPGAEEWSIHDHDGFRGIHVEKNPDLSRLVTHAEMLREYGAAWGAFCEYSGDGTPSEFEDSFAGEWDSPEAYVEDLLESTGGLAGAPEILSRYFDFEAYARDLELSGETYFPRNPNGGVYAFHSY